jgi:hypothetical protein
MTPWQPSIAFERRKSCAGPASGNIQGRFAQTLVDLDQPQTVGRIEAVPD